MDYQKLDDLVTTWYGWKPQIEALQAEGFHIASPLYPTSYAPQITVYARLGSDQLEVVAQYKYEYYKGVGYWTYTEYKDQNKITRGHHVRSKLEGTVYSHLHLWYPAGLYSGAYPVEFYPVIGYHRESPLVDVSNYQVMRSRIEALLTKAGIDINEYVGVLVDKEGGLSTEEGEPLILGISKCGNDLVGWTESLMLHKSTPTHILEAVNDLLQRLDGYPILSDDHYTELQDNEVWDYWQRACHSERLDYCRKVGIDGRAARNNQALSKYHELAQYLTDRVIY